MPFNRLSTAKIAKAVGCHPNTVRLYEQIGFIAPVPRSPKGYRLYTSEHLDQMRLARLAMLGDWPGPNIRHALIALARQTGQADYCAALELAYKNRDIVRQERAQAEAAVEFLTRWAHGELPLDIEPPLQISQVAKLLNISLDVLRNWERSGLISVPRSPANRYRQYRAAEIGRLRVIRLLRQSGYSPMAILRMLVQFDQGAAEALRTASDFRRALDTPRPDEDIVQAADRWLSSLAFQEQRAEELIILVRAMLEKYV